MTAADRGGLVVIGGGPAALAAAIGYRRGGGAGPVHVLSADTDPPYARPPLSKAYLRGQTSEDSLELQQTRSYNQHGIRVALGEAATALEVEARCVTAASGAEFTFGACVLATGSHASPLPVPGGDDPRVFLLRSLNHARALRAAAQNASSAVVVGSGFIGCEAAASLAVSGLAVTMVSAEALPQAARLGPVVGERVAGWLREAGVTLIGDAQVSAITDGRTVHLAGAEPITGDLVLTAVGVAPQSQLAAEAGLAVRDGRVVVDGHLRTMVAGVYAAGDVALAYNPTAGRHLAVEHWGEAEAMGTVAGTGAAGGDAQWDVVPGFWTEIGERTLKYAAWGDGYDEARLVSHDDDAFTVHYGRGGVTVGVLTHNRDGDYERGAELVAAGAPLP